ncbi:MAG: Ig-like domain-containing protein [Planctomycetota bacterium]
MNAFPVAVSRWHDTGFSNMRLIALAWLALIAVACVDQKGEQGSLFLTDFAQVGSASVRLNETLVFRFDHEIDPSSINPSTVSICNNKGETATGQWVVQGKEVRYYPRLPRKSDGSDTGLVPGQRYSVYFKGFPAYDAILSAEGFHLRQSCSLSFTTVSSPDFCIDLFIDPQPDSGPELLSIGGTPIADVGFEGIEVQADEKLEMDFSEPIFPGSIANSRAEICVLNVEKTVDGLALDVEYGSRGSQLFIEPVNGFQPGRRYKLLPDKLDFTDFGGKSVEARFNYLEIVCVQKAHSPPDRNRADEENR